MGEPPGEHDRASGQAGLLLERYGIVAREFHRREDLLPWGLIAPELTRMELKGEIRRGYFVEGLSGMQFALPRAVEELRKIRSEGYRPGVVLLNACDPANPYGPGVDFSPGGERGNTSSRHSFPLDIHSVRRRDPVPSFRILRSEDPLGRGAVRRDSPEGARALCRPPQAPGVPPPVQGNRCRILRRRPAGREPPARSLQALGFVRDSNQTMRRDEYA